MTITFDSVELIDPEPFEQSQNISISETILLSGKRSIQSSTEKALDVKFSCITETYTDISNLKAKIGLKKTLDIDGTTYTCYISSFSEREGLGYWEYEVGFKEDNT
jgi:hypothetical protein